MEIAVKERFGRMVKSCHRITGGYTFETFLLTLEDGEKVVFRTRDDFVTGGGRLIAVGDVFRREAFFYRTINRQIGPICPEVLAIDDSRKIYERPYQITAYIEGTPLHLAMEGFSAREKEAVCRKIGGLAARIHAMKIEEDHPYTKERGPWEAFFAARLRERLLPLVPQGLIAQDEIERICRGMLRQKAKETRSFLHLDLRFVNMIWRDGEIFLLDAENCEFGDPLWDLTVADMAGYLDAAFWAGYEEVSGSRPDVEGALYSFYKLERLALVLDVFLNEVKSVEDVVRGYLAEFSEMKRRLLLD